MEQGWLLLKVGRDLEVAVELSRVHRVLHRGSPDYGAHAAQAVALDRFLDEPADRSLPGVVVVLSSGSDYYVGDADLVPSSRGLSFRPVPPDLLSGSPPWCRGVLVGEGHWAYVAEPSVLEAARG